MDKKYGEFVGVRKLHVAPVTADDATAYTAGTPEYCAPASEISIAAPSDATPEYYDNVAGVCYNSEGMTALKIIVSGLPAAKVAEYTGKYYDETTGRVIDNGNPNPPDYALSFLFDKGPDGARYYQYLKGSFTGGEEIGKTKTRDGVTVNTYQLTYNAVTTTHEWTVDGKSTGVKRIYADSMDANFNGGDDWFSAVQTPSAEDDDDENTEQTPSQPSGG